MRALAILVALMFVLSFMPLGFAEERSGADASKERIAAAREKVADAKEKAQERISNAKEKAAEMKAKATVAREKFSAAKDKIDVAKKSYDRAKENFELAKERYKKSKNKANEAELVAKVKEHLHKSLDRMIEHLNLVKGKVSDHQGLTDDQKAKITAELDNFIADFTDMKAKIDAAATIKDLEKISRDAKEKWKKVQKGIQRAQGRVLNGHLKGMIEKGENLAGRIEKQVESLKAKGTDTSKLETWLTAFKAKLASAKSRYDEARKKYEDASFEEREDIIAAGRVAANEANEYLKQAFKDLREILKEMKSLGVDTATESEDSENTAEGSAVPAPGPTTSETAVESTLTTVAVTTTQQATAP